MANESLTEELMKIEIVNEMEKVTIKDQEEEELETFVIWSGGSWWTFDDDVYTGKNLVKHVFKMSIKNLTHELLFKHARKVLGLSLDERFSLSYEYRLLSAGLGLERDLQRVDIVDEKDFEYFMELVDDTVPKPITFYHVNLVVWRPKKLVGLQDEGYSQFFIDRMSTVHHSWMGEESHIQLPNHKVGVLFGKGGETIKNVMTRSGARIQHFPKFFDLKGLTLRVTGDRRQIEMAEDMITEVMNQEDVENIVPAVTDLHEFVDYVLEDLEEATDMLCE